MDTRASADAGCKLNPERLKYVTEHFHELQGLTNIAMGAGFLLFFSLRDVYPDPWPWLSILLSVLPLLALYYLPKYYRRRFGWIEPRSMTNKQFVLFLMVLLVLLFFGRPIGRYADSILADVQSMIPPHAVTFSPALYWTLYLCLRSRKNPHQEDVYRMYFVASGALAWALVALYPIWNPDAIHPALWKFLNDGWFGLSFIALGLYDHLTLVRLMPKRIEKLEDDNDDINLD